MTKLIAIAALIFIVFAAGCSSPQAQSGPPALPPVPVTKAQLKNARAESTRFEQLSKEGISTRQQEDQVRTAAEVAEHGTRGDEAAIESLRAALESDRAAVEQAKLYLDYCRIHAPISGR